MSMSVTRGRVPRTLHAEIFSEPGVLSLEEIHGASGGAGEWSRKYHYRKHPVHQIRDPHKLSLDLRPQALPPLALQSWRLRAGRLKAHGDVIAARVPLLHGPATSVCAARFEKSCPADRFFRNGDGHELWFVQEGRGLLASEYGVLPFRPGQYVIIPKGTTYRVELESEDCFLLMIESRYPVRAAAEHLNASGHAALSAPYVETEAEGPEFRPPRDEEGVYRVWTKHDGGFVTESFLGHHPFDLLGWEGALFPYAAAAEQRAFHSGLTTGQGLTVRSFDDADAPEEYAHSNPDCDEAFFFTKAGLLTFHPGALPHAPQGTAARRSHAERGQLSEHLTVSLESVFEPLRAAKQALPIADKEKI
ncbi:MAG: homogentisate 1,2-dioxygenase [Elusimicrobiota bacterium]